MKLLRSLSSAGICSSGSGVGTLIFPPLITYLIDKFSFSGTLMLLAGILLNCCVCGAFYRPLKVCNSQNVRTRTATNRPQVTSAAETADAQGENHNLFPPLENLGAHFQGHSQGNLGEGSVDFCQRRWTMTAHDTGMKSNGSDQRSTGQKDPPRRIYHRSELLELLPPLDRHAVAVHRNRRPFFHVHQHHHHCQHQHRGAMIRDFASCPELAINHSNIQFQKDEKPPAECSDRSRAQQKVVYICSLKKRFLKFWQMIFDLELLLDWKFITFFISNFILYAWYDLPYLFLPDYGMEMGIDETSSALLISILGGMNTVGQIMVGYLGDLRCVDPVLLYAIWIVLTGVANLFLPLLTSFATLVVYVCCFGIFVSANYSLCSVIIVDLFGIEKLTTGYGLLLLGQGFANSVFPPVIGEFLCFNSKFFVQCVQRVGTAYLNQTDANYQRALKLCHSRALFLACKCPDLCV